MTRMIQAALGAAMLLGLGLIAPANAQTRVFVAAQGSDSNACTFAAFCRTFQHAHNIVAAGGEIDVLDPAGYGALTVGKAISIQGHGFAGISSASGDAVTITAGATDKVNLRGLLLDGVGTGGTGIVFNSGGSLNIQDSSIRNFMTNGIMFQPTASSQLTVSQTLVSDLGNSALAIGIEPGGAAAATAVVDHVELDGGEFGFFVLGSNTTGSVNVTIADSVISNYTSNGIIGQSGSGATNVLVRNCIVSSNGTGITSVGPPAVVRVIGSTITANGTGLSTLSSASLVSYGGNLVDGNQANGAPTSTLPTK